MTEALGDYVAGASSWHQKKFGTSTAPLVGYFSMEFGLTECLPIWSGGLGILAGDHLKSSSDLGVPLVAVGLLYQKGYFRQYLTVDGWQQERYPVNDFSVLPVRPFHGEQSKPVRVSLDVAGQPLVLRPWRAQVGRVTLVLLDSNIPENPPDLQDITDQLYGGDGEMRILQEMVLGIGGVRMLRALKMHPRVFHANEGHSAFLALERVRSVMAEGSLAFPEAMEVVAASGVFTTHTPVSAGIDRFPPDMMEKYFGAFRQELGLSREAFLDLGRVHPGRADEWFNMAVLAIRASDRVNGVSRLHGRVSREMWQQVWPDVPLDEIPISHITNGVHPQTWISEDMRTLYDRYLGPRWAEEPGDTRVWKRGEQIPGEELWRTHERRRERLVAFTRRRLAVQLRHRGAGRGEIAEAAEVLDPEALTIGFARRFATYKRATLLLRDPARLEHILNAPGRPVQILFAGKAHPRDDEGKEFIRQLIQAARKPEFRHRIVFLEDYDQVVARYLVQGVDVWLNTPRRPLEASGTSGMKAAFNGALNISILDGWWDEGYSEETGWAIGRGEDYTDLDYQDRVEANALYDLLESDVVSLFYHRGADNLPRGWIAMMQSAMGALCPVFNTNRMVHQYVLEAYRPAAERRARLEKDGCRRARALAKWKDRVRRAWPEVRVTRVEVGLSAHISVGDDFEVRAWVTTGGLSALDLRVEAYHGRMNESRDIIEAQTAAMAPTGQVSPDGGLFATKIPCPTSGTIGVTVRVVPHHEDLAGAHETKLIAWAATP
ncbi:MAG: alpha-glucan phosphorylase [Acidobacteria bacterium]|nr:alpha-glucan phosphorylase [Acidobacteriota bacterium]